MVRWQGIYKLNEEMGELQQILGKLGPFPHGNHPSGMDLVEAVKNEIADVYAALHYFVHKNKLVIDNEKIDQKLDKYETWGLSGVDDGNF